MGNTKSNPKEAVTTESQKSSDPNKENKIKKSGNATKKPFRSTMESTHDCSSWQGGIDPTDVFRKTIQDQANLGKLPPMCMQHRYQFYIWVSGIGLGHDSIVVGTAEEEYKERYGYFTIELRVDDGNKDGDVIPYTKFMAKEDGDNRKEKWRKTFVLDTTIDQLINFSIELIKHHGTYSSFHNGCQHFVKDFCEKITEAENYNAYREALKHDKTYQKHSEDPCWYSSAAKGYRKCRVNSKTKYLEHHYQTTEEAAFQASKGLFIPAIGIVVSKGVNDDNQRHKVKWNHGGNVTI